MNFTVDRDQLIGMLARVQGVAERRHTMPVLSHTLLSVGKSEARLVASDLEIVVKCVQPVEVRETGSVAVPARKFFDIAKVLPKGPVSVSGREGNSVDISAGRGHFRLAGLSSQEFPEMPEKPKSPPVGVDSEVFRKLVDRVGAFTSQDETRYHMAGILLEKQLTGDKPYLRMVATDGHRLAMADGDVPKVEELLGEREIVVSREMTKLYEEFQRGPVGTVITALGDGVVRGEVTLIVAGRSGEAPECSDAEITRRCEQLRREGGEEPSRRDLAERIAQETGVSRRRIYRLLLFP